MPLNQEEFSEEVSFYLFLHTPYQNGSLFFVQATSLYNPYNPYPTHLYLNRPLRQNQLTKSVQ